MPRRTVDPVFDAVVIGGGPAGTAAGLTLLKRPGTSVALLERGGYAAPRIGESLSPGVRPLLEYLDLWEDFRAQSPLTAFGSQAAWGAAEAGSLDYLFTPHGVGWCLDRAGFDRLLAERFRDRGGRLLTGQGVRAVERRRDGLWNLRTRDRDGRERSLRARFLVDVSGRSGRLARGLGAVRIVHDRLVGVARIGRLPPGAEVEQTILVEACEDGWWYSAPIPGNRLSVVLMSDADIVGRRRAARPERWSAQLAAMPLTNARARDLAFETAPRAFPAGSARLDPPGGPGWVAVGDAVAAHDPLSSTGIPHALATGIHGARVAANALFADGSFLAGYREGLAADFGHYLTTRWRTYRRETRWPEAPFWQRRRATIDLDPLAVIARVAGTGDWRTSHLPAPVAQQIRAGCRPDRPVHEVLRVVADANRGLPHERLILGLQDLVAAGRVELAARAA